MYLFKNASGKILYIGKASNLKERLRSYKNTRTLPQAKQKMMREASILETKQTLSEPEALILEASLIKKYRPPYNVLLRDDKNYFFVAITRERFPRIFITHRPSNARRLKLEAYAGPFTDGNALKHVLRMLRTIFPYCTCKRAHMRLCVNAEIGRCPGFCCNKNAPSENKKLYGKNIKNIIAILSGKQQTLLKKLRKEMARCSKKKQYEKAAIIRDQAISIEKIFSHSSVIKRDFDHDISRALRALEELFSLTSSERIEGYDISNIQGKMAVGSMVVFQNGVPKKEQYRRFKIKTIQGANDPAMIEEIVKRRFHNSDWPLPDFMLIDGGRPQLNAALAAQQETSGTKRARIAIAALAKREEELYLPRQRVPLKLYTLPSPLLYLLQHIRNEAHRFAISYHRRLHKKSLIP